MKEFYLVLSPVLGFHIPVKHFHHRDFGHKYHYLQVRPPLLLNLNSLIFPLDSHHLPILNWNFIPQLLREIVLDHHPFSLLWVVIVCLLSYLYPYFHSLLISSQTPSNFPPFCPNLLLPHFLLKVAKNFPFHNHQGLHYLLCSTLDDHQPIHQLGFLFHFLLPFLHLNHYRNHHDHQNLDYPILICYRWWRQQSNQFHEQFKGLPSIILDLDITVHFPPLVIRLQPEWNYRPGLWIFH